MNLRIFSLINFALLILHEIEEAVMRFWDKYPFFDMPQFVFVYSNIIFTFIIFCVLVYLDPQAKNAKKLAQGFNMLMFINGVWHISWAIVAQNYMPGLITGSVFVAMHLAFYIKWKRGIYSLSE